jgi:hypothetical protein
MRLTRLLITLASALPVWSVSTSAAHGVDARRVEVVLRGQDLEVVVTPPAEYLRGADTDGDLMLTRREVAESRAWIRQVVLEALTVADVDGAPLQIVGADVSTPADGAPEAPRSHVRFTLRGRFDSPPRALRLGVSFVTPSDPVVVVGARASWSGAPGRMQFDGPRETAFLTADAPVVTFLGPPGVDLDPTADTLWTRVERFVAALMDGKL